MPHGVEQPFAASGCGRSMWSVMKFPVLSGNVRFMTLLVVASVASVLVAFAGDSAPAAEDSGSNCVLWYRQPASEWTDALPVGNGRLGAMVFGAVATEHIQLNEETIWSGDGVPPIPGGHIHQSACDSKTTF